ncbi:HSP20-like chaperone [Xylogone sp. PMI_703]|nr:HSP20-like chaperone [Xylogone sp. PMI_703]
MAFPFNNQFQHAFWGSSQNRNGEGVDHHTTPPPFWGAGAPPTYPQGSSVPFGPGFPFLFAGPRGFGYVPGPHEEAFGHGLFGGDFNHRGRRHGHPWHGRHAHGRRGHREEQRQEGEEEHDRENERGSRSRSRSAHRESDPLQGEQSAGNENEAPREGPRHDQQGFRGGYGRRGRGFHHGRAWPRGGFGGFGRFGGPGAQVPQPYPFDLSGLAAAFQDHPWAQNFREYLRSSGINLDGQNTGAAAREAPDAAGDNETPDDEDTDQSFTPPVDIFTTSTSYVLHVPLPGAKKEDVGINWDADRGELNIAGVIYRNGDEEFLNNIVQSERKVGMFERVIKLPPPGIVSEEKEEVDSDHIVAKLEDGVLVVTVPKVEREWTEIKKVDIL